MVLYKFALRCNENDLCYAEEVYHLEHENYEQHMTLNVFKGSVKEAIQVAADNGQLNDHLMAIAPLGTLCQYSLHYEGPRVKKELIYHVFTQYVLYSDTIK